MVNVRKSVLAVAYLDVFIDMLGFSIVIPALPFVSMAFGRDTGLEDGMLVGVVSTAYALGQFFGSFFFGTLSDRMGRRKLMLFGIGMQSLAFLATGFAATYEVLVLTRFLSGLMGGTIPIGFAIIADVTEPKERATYLAWMSATLALGFVIGPALGAALAPFPFSVTAFVAAGLCTLNFITAVLFLIESHPKFAPTDPAVRNRVIVVDLGMCPPKACHRTTHNGSDTSETLDELERGDHMPAALDSPEMSTDAPPRITWANYVVALRNTSLLLLFLTCFVGNMMLGGFTSTYGVLAFVRFGTNVEQLGLVFTGLGISSMVVQVFATKPLTARFEERTLVLVAILIGSAVMFLLPVVPWYWLFITVTIILGVGTALFDPNFLSLLFRLCPPESKGLVVGLLQSVFSLARTLGPFFMGSLFDVLPGLPYYVVGAMHLMTFAVVWRIHPPPIEADDGKEQDGTAHGQDGVQAVAEKEAIELHDVPVPHGPEVGSGGNDISGTQGGEGDGSTEEPCGDNDSVPHSSGQGVEQCGPEDVSLESREQNGVEHEHERTEVIAV